MKGVASMPMEAALTFWNEALFSNQDNRASGVSEAPIGGSILISISPRPPFLPVSRQVLTKGEGDEKLCPIFPILLLGPDRV